MKFKPAHKKGSVVVEFGPGEKPFLAPAASGARPEFSLARILVAVDFSALSRKAVDYAAAFSRQFDAELSLVHVIQLYPLLPEMAPVDIEPVQDAQANLDELKATVGHGINCQTFVRTGDPQAELINTAKELGADLIVIGTHGRTGLARVMLGGTAEKVVRHAGCPVLVVRESERDFVSESDGISARGG